MQANLQQFSRTCYFVQSFYEGSFIIVWILVRILVHVSPFQFDNANFALINVKPSGAFVCCSEVCRSTYA